MKLTVAICTWNRADLLDKTLEGMRELRIPAALEWELLVVDNNSTDHTQKVIESHCNLLPLQPLEENKQGLSHARNCAIEHANGELIVWTDDDVLVDREWLSEYARAAEEYRDYQFFGGLIEPWFEGSPPEWMRQTWARIESAYAARDLSQEEFDFCEKRVPFGANYAVRSELQKEHRYDPLLGRNGTRMVGGEEVAVIREFLSKGDRGRWLPHAKVKHFIPRERQNLGYLRKYYQGQGAVGGPTPVTDKSLFGRPRWLWRAWLEAEFRYQLHRWTKTPSVWIEDLIESSRYRGQLHATTGR